MRNAEPETRNPKRVKIKILSVKIADDLSSAEIGKFQNIDGRLYVKCGQGALIIEKLQPEGKKEMSGQEFINGYFK